jgi:hypothetical protein
VIPDGEYTAVVDRIEDGSAAILVEEDGTDAYELAVEPSDLPSDAQAADAVLTVVVRNGELVDAHYEPAETEKRRASAQHRFDRLSERPPSDDETGEE